MKEFRVTNQILLIVIVFLSAPICEYAQDIRWLRVGELQSPFNEIGAEFETEFNFPGGNSNYFSWPAQYGINQNVTRNKGLLIGCTNFQDPVEGKLKSVKVVGSGFKGTAMPDQIFPVEIKLIGKFPHPQVYVDDIGATILDNYDILDEEDENLPCDRMIIIKFHTSMGITVTKKVMAFSQSDQSNYFIYDYVFKNTGIINGAGTVSEQELDNVWFYFFYRYALAGESVTGGFNSTWGHFNSTWGENTLNHAFGEDPTSADFNNPNNALYNMRGFYSWYGPFNGNPRPSYDEDWGCPKLDEPGVGTLSSAKYAGIVTLHADKGSQDQTDDINQPRTTWYLSPDINITSNTTPSQYDEAFMSDRWTAITEGHPELQHDEIVGDNYPSNYKDPRRNQGGGVAMGQGFGPYHMVPGDSVHLVFAEAVSGISFEKAREVGSNWMLYKNGTGSPVLTLPDGSQTNDYNEYKRVWVVEASRDSIIQTFRNAMDNYGSDYTLPQPPPPPGEFNVVSGGDRIRLTWADNAASDLHFDGYIIYRSRGNVLTWNTLYEKVFECDKTTAVHEFDDVTAARGFDYYYYIQSKDDGTQVPGTVLKSSLFWTVTGIGATLQRPAGDFLSEVRVVPNPYDIRGRLLQFGDESQYDRIAFYGLPPKCIIKIFTERGDMIWEKDHTKGTGDELWDSKTMYGQIVASGIYILYVEVTEDIYAAEDRVAIHDILDDELNIMYRAGDVMFKAGDLIYQKGNSKFRKFVIIR